MTATPTGLRGDYLEVAGLRLYYERSDEFTAGGPPLLLLHGGLLNIDLSFAGLLAALVSGRGVIALELQGHGRSSDGDRPFTVSTLASDVTALLDELGLEQVDILGFSLGGLVATEFAVEHPGRVRRLILASTHFRGDGYHAEINDPGLHATSTRMPSEADFAAMQQSYAELAPDPDHFAEFLAKASAAVGSFDGWSDEAIAGLPGPTLLVVGDHDFVRLEHSVDFRRTCAEANLRCCRRLRTCRSWTGSRFWFRCLNGSSTNRMGVRLFTDVMLS
ncbi:pimeloyl-ACP methyl ester carboxylesterase [Jatrophihabitans sp. GAS493]|uniref:alpha/beta fold hydrolase n=1 Tax=Jatrophihabitans sp. GAS493 TaxID=1907575 RepID=UPI000BBF9AC6|nr:alpha/beta hydrolase [Jatrophihabitans sp. GAS493]SOD71141.1 pimeloyl-ACP methyl ester carboxylesterase [Jatrophihabitans sp. GAS493]